MAGETKLSPLADRVGSGFGDALFSVLNETRGVDAEPPGGGQLPPGINNGIAHLKRINFGTYQTGNFKGKPYFQAFGVIYLPKQHNGITVYMKQTKTQPEALCDTTDPNEKREPGDNKRRTLVEHLRHIVNLLKNVNGQQDPPAPNQGEPIKAYLQRFEQWCHNLCKQSIYFSFRTWLPDKQEIENAGRMGFFVTSRGRRISSGFPTEEALRKKYPNIGKDQQVQEVWEQRVDFTPEAPPVDDGTPTPNGQQHQVVEEDMKYIQQPNGNGGTHPEAAEAVTPIEEMGLEDLLVAALTEGEEYDSARLRLTNLAIESGYTQEEIEQATWETVAEWCNNPKQSTEPEPQEEYVPQKGQKCKAKVPDVKNKGQLKEVTCDIVNVDTHKHTVELRNIQTKTLYKGVKWSDLVTE